MKGESCMIRSEDSHRNAFLLYRKWGPRGEGKTDSFFEGEAKQTRNPQGHGSIGQPGQSQL